VWTAFWWELLKKILVSVEACILLHISSCSFFCCTVVSPEQLEAFKHFSGFHNPTVDEMEYTL
jgi:hypothetical protein